MTTRFDDSLPFPTPRTEMERAITNQSLRVRSNIFFGDTSDEAKERAIALFRIAACHGSIEQQERVR